jgi:4-methyl-5(b-hydroxyethyl)-thiazole monophosphate biosynthesis
MARRVLVAVAHGSEDIETITVVDVLRRASAYVALATVETDDELELARKTRVVPDMRVEAAASKDWDLIVLPGGMPGAKSLGDSKTLVGMLHKQKAAHKWYGAICAAPAVALLPHGLLPSKATCYPSFAKEFPEGAFQHQSVVSCDHCSKSFSVGFSEFQSPVKDPQPQWNFLWRWLKLFMDWIRLRVLPMLFSSSMDTLGSEYTGTFFTNISENSTAKHFILVPLNVIFN